MYNIALAILIKKGILSQEEGEFLAVELESTPISSNFDQVQGFVDRLFEDFEYREAEKKKDK